MATIQDLTPLIGALYGFNVAFGVWDNFPDRLVGFLGRLGLPMGGMVVAVGSAGVNAKNAKAAKKAAKKGRKMRQFNSNVELGRVLCLVFAVVCTSALIYAGFDPKYELHLWSVIPLCPVLVAPVIATVLYAALNWRHLEEKNKYLVGPRTGQ